MAPFTTSTNVCSSRYSKVKIERRLQRLLEKKKHRYSFEAVSHTQLGNMVNNASTPRKGTKFMGPEDSVKLKTYNTILHEHVDELLNSNVISQELQDLQVSIIGVRLTKDMSTCRIFWQAGENYEDNEKIQSVLDSHSGRIRHALISHRILGKIPQLAFLQDRTAALRAEIESLLQKADLPDPAEDTQEADGVSAETVRERPLVGEEDGLNKELEPVLGLDRSQIQRQLRLMKLKNQKWDFEDSGITEGSIEKFKRSVKKRKKARDKGLYEAGSYWRQGMANTDDFDENYSDEDDNWKR